MEELIEKMAVILQWIYDDGEGGSYRPNIQEVLVAYNASHLAKCDHSSSIVIHEWKEYRITLLLCTWACGETYWTIAEGITSREISAAEACKKIVGC